jgi:hypothetical protein
MGKEDEEKKIHQAIYLIGKMVVSVLYSEMKDNMGRIRDTEPLSIFVDNSVKELDEELRSDKKSGILLSIITRKTGINICEKLRYLLSNIDMSDMKNNSGFFEEENSSEFFEEENSSGFNRVFFEEEYVKMPLTNGSTEESSDRSTEESTNENTAPKRARGRPKIEDYLKKVKYEKKLKTTCVRCNNPIIARTIYFKEKIARNLCSVCFTDSESQADVFKIITYFKKIRSDGSLNDLYEYKYLSWMRNGFNI